MKSKNTNTQVQEIKLELRKYAKEAHGTALSRFFKTGRGEYGEGDIFIGVKVPDMRSVVKKFKDVSLEEILELLKSPIHEERQCALCMMVRAYGKETEKEKKNIFKSYLSYTKYINNWDLVDISAPKIVGEYLLDKDRSILYKLAKSQSLWERRIAIIATFAFIKRSDLSDSFNLARELLLDKQDLIHKAVGWVLRETGKKNQVALEKFLRENVKIMPRTMLRYAIEKFSEEKRKYYLKR